MKGWGQLGSRQRDVCSSSVPYMKILLCYYLCGAILSLSFPSLSCMLLYGNLSSLLRCISCCDQNGHWEILEDGKQVPNTDTARQFSTLVLGTDCGFKHDVKLQKLQLKAFQIWQRFNEQTQQPWRTGSALLVYQFCGHLYEVADSWGKTMHNDKMQ